MAGFLWEVVCKGTMAQVPCNNVWHVFDGSETETAEEIADIFEDFIDLLVDAQSGSYLWTAITVKGLDVGNLTDPITRVISVVGAGSNLFNSVGDHASVKLVSEDNGFKSGGKLIGGLVDGHVIDGILQAPLLDPLVLALDGLLADLATATLALAIYRPTLSTPGFPEKSITSAYVIRGHGTNNRRQPVFQNPG
jgi:hypothetical protein